MAILDEQNQSVNVADVGSYYIDQSSNLTLRDIDSEALRKSFIPLKSEFLQFGLVKGNVWVRVDIAQNLPANTPAVLHIKAPRVQVIDVYTPGLTNNQIFKEMGEARAFDNRSVSYPDYVVPLPANVPPVYTLYVKVNSHLPINFLVEIKTLSALAMDMEQDLTITGLLLGILFMLFACNMFFFIKTRRSMYGVYSLLLIGIAALHLSMHGFIYQLLPSFSGLQERLYNFNSLACAAAITYFTRSYLSTKDFLPRTDRALLAIGFIDLVLAVLYSLAPSELNIALLTLAAAFTLLFLFGLSIYAVSKKLPYSKYYFTARLVLTSGYITWVLSAYGIVPLPSWFEWGLTVSIILEALIHFTGLMTNLTPGRNSQTKTEVFAADNTALLDDIATRIKNQTAIVEYYEQNQHEHGSEKIKRAHANLTHLAEKLTNMHRIHANTPPSHSYSTINLQILIEQALTGFQSLDQNDSEIELHYNDISCWELTAKSALFKHMFQTIMEELKHHTDQVLSIDTEVEILERDSLKNLHIEVYPLPSSIEVNAQHTLGCRYLNELVQYLEGTIQIEGEGRNRKMIFDIPVALNYIEASELAKKTHNEELVLVIVGQDSDEIERAQNILHSRLFSVAHIDQLDELLSLLHYRHDTSRFSILLFEDKENFGTSQLERFKSELHDRDTCLLISNDVKMSKEYASNLGFDSYIYSANIESMLIAELERLNKEDKLILPRVNRHLLSS
ncbi:7TM diverse intracellular signaling domain-containing protein [Marinomonas ostreistagni]|uniref:7TMR-DISM family protein n=1 Tax=Marinomonas ostreistagni TaxID=359209 RepID=UPI0019515FA4|nr:7TM diverse intracellular signaling domain-containing protein [Marinomonas ostreistagni]MBM6549651.1 hypothetical protein [Marinomonas ostreistagni]